jgi:hypothetical protein
LSEFNFQVQLECREGYARKLIQAIETAWAIARDADPPLVLLTEPGIEQQVVCTTVGDLEKYFKKKEIPNEPAHAETIMLLGTHGAGSGDSGQVP